MPRPCPVHPKLRALLDASGRSWDWRHRSSHWQLLLDGVPVLTSPYRKQDRDGRQWLNALSCVKRALRVPA